MASKMFFLQKFKDVPRFDLRYPCTWRCVFGHKPSKSVGEYEATFLVRLKNDSEFRKRNQLINVVKCSRCNKILQGRIKISVDEGDEVSTTQIKKENPKP